MQKELPSLGVETMNAIFGGKWRPLILLHLILRPRHYGELRRLIPGLSKKVLTQHLRELEAEGIVSRHARGTAPSPVEYALTDYGRSVVPVLDAMCKWGHLHAKRLPKKRRKTIG